MKNRAEERLENQMKYGTEECPDDRMKSGSEERLENQMKYGTEERSDDRMKSEAEERLENQMKSEAEERLENQMKSEAEERLENQMKSEAEERLENQMKSGAEEWSENPVKNARESLYDVLQTYSRSDFYPFHMPGHKRQLRPFTDPYAIDITEIEGFDNLHHAEGILLEAQRRAAHLYHAEETFYLVNGSTCGILAAVSAAALRGGKLLMARNCHKAAYHAVLLNDLEAVYLYPQADMVRGINGGIDPDDVQEALQADPQIGAVLITSPTYDGVVSDVRRIAGLVHDAGGILIVDEAHGAHFGMHPYFPEHALSCGADLVINSIHKTLPAMTQTALLHVQGSRVNRERLRRYLGIYQSSSPSYVLMAGIDACVRLLEAQGDRLFAAFTERLEQLRDRLSRMQALHLTDGKEQELYSFDFDRSKVLISTERTALSGADLSARLRSRYHLEMEMEAEHYVTAITTIGDTAEGLQRLGDALLELDRELCREELHGKTGGTQKRSAGQQENGKDSPAGQQEAGKDSLAGQQENRKDSPAGQQENGADRSAGNPPAEPIRKLDSESWPRSEAVMRIAEASDAERQSVPLEESGGRISAEFVYLYPPGIPLLVPGEQIVPDLLRQLVQYRSLGLKLQGLADYQAREIQVVRETGQRKETQV